MATKTEILAARIAHLENEFVKLALKVGEADHSMKPDIACRIIELSFRYPEIDKGHELYELTREAIRYLTNLLRS